MREIAQLGNKVLRQKAEAVADVHDAEIRQIIEALQSTLASTSGVGIA
ncbi:MAG: peptide deformylase, partial [Methylobacter sp.]